MRNIVVDKVTNETIIYRDDVSFNCLGVHKICDGFVYMHQISEHFNVLNCRHCGMRKLFPATIDLIVFDRDRIWWELSEYFSNLNKEKS